MASMSWYERNYFFLLVLCLLDRFICTTSPLLSLLGFSFSSISITVIISLCRESPLKMSPIQFFCLFLIISIKDLSLPLFRYFFIRSVLCPADPLRPPSDPHSTY